jgi:hypothetical protein
MAALSVCKPRQRVDFAPLVLRGLLEIGHYEEELCLELGVSYWINRSEVTLDEAVVAMLAMRDALIGVSGLSAATEPIPICGVNSRVDVLNLASYLRGLIVRATREANCGARTIIENALHFLEGSNRPSARIRALR